MAEFHCFYECSKCKTKHRGGVKTPDSVAMVPAAKPNEWVFQCVPECKPGAQP